MNSNILIRRHERHNKSLGIISLHVLIFSSVALVVMTGLFLWVEQGLKLSIRATDRALAFTIAEAGVDYYRWHLAHAPEDYQDGTGQAGPYIHDFQDKNGDIIGQFLLEIDPPPVGSTVVTIRSKGIVAANPSITRIIEVKMAFSSLVKFAAVINDNVRFGPGTEVFGPIHSNGGIRFDGLAHNLVTSAREEYNDPDHSGNVEFGVHTHIAPIDPPPPNPIPNRPDIFEVGREFPVPIIDFVGISEDMAELQAVADDSGTLFGDSGDEGYHIILKTDDTFDLYRVTSVVRAPNGCLRVIGQQDWGTWSINNQSFLGNYDFPASGVIFFEDDVWVDGAIDGARLTIAAGRLPENPSSHAHITVNNDLLYSNYDGSDSIGLIAQGNFNVGWDSEDDLRIDAAIVAQFGRVGRYYYRPPSGNKNRCAPHHVKDTITTYGMIASSERYGFAYTDGTGYQNRNLIYDPNLLFNPPPNFPQTADQYEQIYWREID